MLRSACFCSRPSALWWLTDASNLLSWLPLSNRTSTLALQQKSLVAIPFQLEEYAHLKKKKSLIFQLKEKKKRTFKWTACDGIFLHEECACFWTVEGKLSCLWQRGFRCILLKRLLLQFWRFTRMIYCTIIKKCSFLIFQTHGATLTWARFAVTCVHTPMLGWGKPFWNPIFTITNVLRWCFCFCNRTQRFTDIFAVQETLRLFRPRPTTFQGYVAISHRFIEKVLFLYSDILG